MLRHVQREHIPQAAAGLLFGAWVRSAAEPIMVAQTTLDILTSAGVIPPRSLPVVRRLSTVPGRLGSLISRRA
jgi:hypothetical protein